MYKIGIILTFLLLVTSFGTLEAQNLNNIQRGQRGYVPPPIDRVQGGISIENTVEQVDDKMDLYEVELSLDSFEKAVMKNYVLDFEKEKMALLENENIAYDVKQKSVLKLNEALSIKLATLLNEEELSRFNHLHFAPKGKKKKKKRKNKDKTQ